MKISVQRAGGEVVGSVNVLDQKGSSIIENLI
jgi:hypothetical protein